MRSFQLCSFEACKLIPYFVFRSTYLFVYFWLDCGCYSVPGKSVFYSNGVQGNSVQLHTIVYKHNSTKVWQSKSLPSQVAQPNSTSKRSGEPDYSEPTTRQSRHWRPICKQPAATSTLHSSTLHGTAFQLHCSLQFNTAWLHFSLDFSCTAPPTTLLSAFQWQCSSMQFRLSV